MRKGHPSMTALLGLLAIAGYQNRDEIAELLKGSDQRVGHSPVPPVPTASSSRSAAVDRLAGLLGGVGGLIASGLSELVEHFTRAAPAGVGTGRQLRR